MIQVPALIPFIIPDKVPTVAIPVLLLIQLPPLIASERSIEVPTQTIDGPEMAEGDGVTEIVVVVKQPVARATVIIVVPNEIPVTTPVNIPIIATDGLLLVQLPPVVASNWVIEDPTQTEVGPVMVEGRLFTVNVAVV